MNSNDDIVTRLRQFGDSNGLDAEAADEIEKLRAEVNTMACAQGGWGQLGRVKAENERLRSAIETYIVAVQDCYCTPKMEREALEMLKEARRG